MSGTIGIDQPGERLYGYLLEGSVWQSYRLIDELLGAGWDLEDVVTEVLARVQRQVGRAWRAGELTVAQEHAATAIVDDLLGSLGRLVAPPSRLPALALVCAEGEWHVTPARMATLLLRQHGWRTTFLGGSTPADHLRRSLELTAPDVVAVSCTDPLALPGAGRVASVARSLGIPTLAGGAGFGPDGSRAHALGIDGWAPDVTAASSVLRGWLDEPPVPRSGMVEPATEVPLLEAGWTSMVDQAVARLSSAVTPAIVHGARPLGPLRRDLRDLLLAAYLASVLDDPRLVIDFVAWLRTGDTTTGLPGDAVLPSVRLLCDLTAARADHEHTGLRFVVTASATGGAGTASGPAGTPEASGVGSA